jgi:hypothetical protein
MMLKRAVGAVLLASMLTSCAGAQTIRLTPEQAAEIAKRVYQNEAGGKPKFLTHWNEGEEFGSFGIGHFIWYPEDYRGPFDESFPELKKFFVENRIKLPAWLQDAKTCPWKTRKEFYEDFEGPRLTELRKLLEDTIPIQARFLARRVENALPKMLATLPENQRDPVQLQFYRVADHPIGVYALVDYVNFKGEGVKDTERYNGQGWGLLQVLQEMKGSQTGQPALDEFARAAEAMLERRVRNSPPERNESRWLPSWKKRIQTYRG